MKRLMRMKRPLTPLLAVLSLALVAALAAPPAQADVTLTSGTSEVKISPDSSAGMWSWTVNGAQQMYQQWFWYRVGDAGGEAAINTLAAPSIAQPTASQVDLTYAGNAMTVLLRYTLTGGSNSSDVAETIKISNTSQQTLSLHFFQYSDFDMAGTSSGDTAQIYAPLFNTVIQSDGASAVSETVVSPTPTRYQVGTWPNIINALNDGNPTTLANVAGPMSGDMTWAFQWDVSLAPGQDFLISKDKLVNVVPVPPAAILFGTGLLGLVGIGLKRRS